MESLWKFIYSCSDIWTLLLLPSPFLRLQIVWTTQRRIFCVHWITGRKRDCFPSNMRKAIILSVVLRFALFRHVRDPGTLVQFQLMKTHLHQKRKLLRPFRYRMWLWVRIRSLIHAEQPRLLSRLSVTVRNSSSFCLSQNNISEDLWLEQISIRFLISLISFIFLRIWSNIWLNIVSRINIRVCIT